nr:MAG TPA: hypothetical protein [Caudoviricetes sp.]
MPNIIAVSIPSVSISTSSICVTIGMLYKYLSNF